MAFALVGAAGAATQGASGAAVTPAYGQTPTAGNLLLLFVSTTGGTGPPGVGISGWTQAIGSQTTFSVAAYIYYRVATGGDAAPTFPAIASTISSAHLEEWSGGATTLPQSRVGSGNTSTSPNTVTLNAADLAVGHLIAMAAGDFRSVARTPNDTWTSNNGTPVIRASNNGVSSVNHYSHATMITTSNAVADTAVLTTSVTTSLTGLAVVAAGFKLAVVGVTGTGQGFLVPATSTGTAAETMSGTGAAAGRAATASGSGDVVAVVPFRRDNRLVQQLAQ